MELLVFPGFSWGLLISAISVAWLCYRLRSVLKTPDEDLIKILGLEVPLAPEVSILDIATSSVALHWKVPEPRSAIAKYTIRVNGILLREVTSQETSIKIENLQPHTFYTVRVIATNAANFQASSEAVRLRTLEACETPAVPEHVAEDGRKISKLPAVVPYKTMSDQNSLLAAPAMTREHSGSHPPGRKGSMVRRSSPNFSTDGLGPDREDEIESGVETVQQLAAKLDLIRLEIRDLEKQDEEEEDEFQDSRLRLGEKREQLKQQLKEKDDESKDLRKTVILLERQHASAQSKKSAQERLLQQKLGEREKMREDLQRWKSEILELEGDEKRLEEQKEDIIEDGKTRAEEVRGSQEEDHSAIKTIEEQIRDRGIQVKDLEEEKKQLEEESISDGSMTEAQRNFSVEDREWTNRLQLLEIKYQSAWGAFNQAVATYQQVQQRFDIMNARRGSLSGMMQSQSYGPELHSELQYGPHLPLTSRAMTQDHARSLAAPPIPGRNSAALGTAFRSSSPFFNTANLDTNFPRSSHSANMTEAEIDLLTGGSLTSPTADALIPANLLGDDVEDVSTRHTHHFTNSPTELVERRPVSTASRPLSINFGPKPPPTSDFLPGLGTIPGLGTTDAKDTDGLPKSPVSPDAQSLRLMSSPQSSLSNLHQHRLSDGPIESDRRSVRSASGSSRAIPTSRRFGDIFSRQRGKTTSNDGPVLGKLRSHQTQSMPRSTDEDELPNATQPKTHRMPGGLFGQMSNAVLGRKALASSKTVDEEVSDSASLGQLGNGRTAMGLFGSRAGLWPRTSATDGGPPSPRPDSTYSESAFPPPSSESQPFGWSTAGRTSRSNSISGNHLPQNPWSHHPSRRQSFYQDSLDIEEERASNHDMITEEESQPQAPIGTKPAKSEEPSAAIQLNPAARDFMSMFRGSSDKNRITPKPSKKQRGQSMSASITSDKPDSHLSFDDVSSFADSRVSRDTHGDDSQSNLSHEFDHDLDHDHDHDHDPNETTGSIPTTPNEPSTPGTPGTSGMLHASGLTAAGSASRSGSLMRKITHKASSSRFSLKSARFSRTPKMSSEDFIGESTDSPTEESSLTSSLGNLRGGGGSGALSFDSPTGSSLAGGLNGDTPTTDKREKRGSSGFSISGTFKRKKDKRKEDEKREKEATATTTTTMLAAGAGNVKDNHAPSISETSMTSDATGNGTGDDGEGGEANGTGNGEERVGGGLGFWIRRSVSLDRE